MEATTTLYRTRPCPFCGQSALFALSPEAVQRYQQGALLQDAFPELDQGQREQLKTGICPSCWESEIAISEED